MDVVLATKMDAELVSENNRKMAKETENIDIDPVIALKGVLNLLNDPGKGFYLLVKNENKIIGQLMITFEWSDWRNSTIWWIQSVYVHPAYRKKGVFHALFKKVKRIAQQNKVSLLRLYVHHSNQSAINVYQRIGMEKLSYVMFEGNV